MEEWKWIKGYEGLYQISNKGRLKSFHKNKNGYVRSNKNSKGWYLTVVLRDKEGHNKTTRIHIEVAKAFIGDIPKGYQVHHKDGNKQNNHVENLQILSSAEHNRITIKENPHILDGMIAYNKNKSKGYKINKINIRRCFRKGKILQYSLSGELLAKYDTAEDAKRKTGICARNILQVANKTPYNKHGLYRKQAGGYVWKYEKEVMTNDDEVLGERK